jgi:hypothetical protein
MCHGLSIEEFVQITPDFNGMKISNHALRTIEQYNIGGKSKEGS